MIFFAQMQKNIILSVFKQRKSNIENITNIAKL